MANWKKIVSSANAKKYTWPVGWDTRDKVAEQLDCAPERVAEILQPAIRAGLVERDSFPVWDTKLQRKLLVTGYREVGTEEAAAPKKAATRGRPSRLSEGAKVIHDNGEKRGTLIKEGKRWGVKWADGTTTYPADRTMRRYEIYPV